MKFVVFILVLLLTSTDQYHGVGGAAPPLAAVAAAAEVPGKGDTDTFIQPLYCYDPFLCATHIPLCAATCLAATHGHEFNTRLPFCGPPDRPEFYDHYFCATHIPLVYVPH
ncbi:hypothetical protein TSUD_122220 [Trifolium subterraneum]|nr:hypothetical protein TSUD_122220 [Trifolium subterraneum]